MDQFRREFLKLASGGLLGGFAAMAGRFIPGARAQNAIPMPGTGPAFDVRDFGAAGDGRTIDTAAVNRAIDAAAEAGGGIVRFRAGIYACYSLHLKSAVMLYLDPGATILAAETPREGIATGGYDAAESNAPFEPYQDFGHGHWHNSLIWGENLHDVAILGPGRIWGKGLSRGHDDADLPRAEAQIKRRVAQVAHGDAGERDVLDHTAVDGFECEAAAALEHAVADGDVPEAAVGFRAAFDASGPVPDIVRKLRPEALEATVQQCAHLVVAGDVAIADRHVFGDPGRAEREGAFGADRVVPG